jgi:hypothetical protein
MKIFLKPTTTLSSSKKEIFLEKIVKNTDGSVSTNRPISIFNYLIINIL